MEQKFKYEFNKGDIVVPNGKFKRSNCHLLTTYTKLTVKQSKHTNNGKTYIQLYVNEVTKNSRSIYGKGSTFSLFVDSIKLKELTEDYGIY